MASELPHLNAAWRRQVVPAVALAVTVICASAAPALAAPGDAVSALTGAVQGTPQTVQQTVAPVGQTATATVDTTLSTVRKATAATPIAEPVADVVEPVRAAPGSALPSRHSALPDSGPGERGAVGKAGALVAGATFADRSTPGATGAGSLASTATSLVGLVMPFSFPEAEAQASSTSQSGGSGGSDHPFPGAPGGTTGGLSAPIGFVLIAAVLAAIFGLAPRFISTPLRMSSFGGHSDAPVLPVERPD